MDGIVIFMVVSLFLYTLFVKHYHLSQCPRCNSNKITIDQLMDHTLFICQTCKFSYKDYYSFYTLTPINEQFEVDIAYCDEDENEDDMEN